MADKVTIRNYKVAYARTHFGLQIRLGEGFAVPRLYGVAYYEPDKGNYVCWPVGLHWLIGGGRAVWYWTKFAIIPSAKEREYKEGWDDGFDSGQDAGFVEGVNAGVKTAGFGISPNSM